MTTDFGGYLSVVKHADRVSTISRTSSDSFEAFATMVAAEGLRAPSVEAHELPSEAPPLDTGEAPASTICTRCRRAAGSSRGRVARAPQEPPSRARGGRTPLGSRGRLRSGSSFLVGAAGWARSSTTSSTRSSRPAARSSCGSAARRTSCGRPTVSRGSRSSRLSSRATVCRLRSRSPQGRP